MKPASRKYLGREYALGSQFRIYLRDDALEVDELTYSEGERTRVYFDDVLLLTYHRKFGLAFLIFTGLFGGLFLLIALMSAVNGSRSEEVVFVVFLVLASPFLLFFALRLIFRVDVITVYGRRTMARMNFNWRKGRARKVYKELAQKIEAHQVRAVREQAAAAPKPPPPPAEPPPPPPSA